MSHYDVVNLPRPREWPRDEALRYADGFRRWGMGEAVGSTVSAYVPPVDLTGSMGRGGWRSGFECACCGREPGECWVPCAGCGAVAPRMVRRRLE